MQVELYRCAHCGQIVALVKSAGVPVVCCGEPMQKLVACTTDAAKEKHVPTYTVDGNLVTVCVGSVEHPMADNHYIEWIMLQTNQGNQRKTLAPGQKPQATFALLDGEKVEAVYAYCNLHGLWK